MIETCNSYPLVSTPLGWYEFTSLLDDLQLIQAQ